MVKALPPLISSTKFDYLHVDTCLDATCVVCTLFVIHLLSMFT